MRCGAGAAGTRVSCSGTVSTRLTFRADCACGRRHCAGAHAPRTMPSADPDRSLTCGVGSRARAGAAAVLAGPDAAAAALPLRVAYHGRCCSPAAPRSLPYGRVSERRARARRAWTRCRRTCCCGAGWRGGRARRSARRWRRSSAARWRASSRASAPACSRAWRRSCCTTTPPPMARTAVRARAPPAPAPACCWGSVVFGPLLHAAGTAYFWLRRQGRHMVLQTSLYVFRTYLLAPLWWFTNLHKWQDAQWWPTCKCTTRASQKQMA